MSKVCILSQISASRWLICGFFFISHSFMFRKPLHFHQPVKPNIGFSFHQLWSRLQFLFPGLTVCPPHGQNRCIIFQWKRKHTLRSEPDDLSCLYSCMCMTASVQVSLLRFASICKPGWLTHRFNARQMWYLGFLSGLNLSSEINPSFLRVIRNR